ncbi:MAG: hypothetical protein IPN33_03760 [Saprospiraceae bacterium]|nr:hypothetical protein [Saprospiraceae bacterium]
MKSHAAASKNKWSFLVIYKNLISNLTKEKVEKCEEFIKEKLSAEIAQSFFKALEEDDDDLPF